MNHKLPLLLFCILLLGACDRNPAPDTSEKILQEKLATQIITRLDIAESVARYKFLNGLPVYDPAREDALLALLVEQGQALGIDADQARSFFLAQFTASRQVQSEKIEAWKNGAEAAPDSAPDLTAEIRPRLDSISLEIMNTLAMMHPEYINADWAAATSDKIRAAGYSHATSYIATRFVSQAHEALKQ